MKLYEILLPAVITDHRWSAKVIDLTHGLTILTPVKGVWRGMMLEEFLPVRIATTPELMHKVALMTKEHYKQESVLYYEISPNVEFV